MNCPKTEYWRRISRYLRISLKFYAVLMVFCVSAAAQSPAVPKDTANTEAPSTSPRTKERGAYSGLPLPRFISLKSSRANWRRGPSFKHPIDWVYLRKGWPVEVIAEFGLWRQVRDIDGTTGWVHQQLLDSTRNVIVIAPEGTEDSRAQFRPLYRQPNQKGTPLAYVEPRTVLGLELCIDSWCEVHVKTVRGYMHADDLWGISAAERQFP